MAAERRFSVFALIVAATTLIATIFHLAFPFFAASCLSIVISSILYVVFAWFAYLFYSFFFFGGKILPKNKAVFITGCDSGFGNELAKRLDSLGFKVFAGCLFPEGSGAKDLKKNCSEKLEVLYLDVTKDESVEKAVNFVKKNLGVEELWAIVNNAGILKGISIELTPTDVYREVLEVNSIGPVRVTKAFLPLLKKSKGRVVNVTSLGGRVCLIGTCAYSMSKYAAVAFTETLSQEMRVWGIRAISIEPEAFRTPMSAKEKLLDPIDENLKNTSEDTLSSYGEDYIKNLKRFLIKYTSILPVGVHFVIDALESAVTDKYPKYAYKPRWSYMSWLVWFLAENVPYGLFENFQLGAVYLFGYPVPKGAKNQS